MNEVTKLRARLKNVNKNVTEYKMTITEAKELLKEIEILENLNKQPVVKEVEIPVVFNRVLDGGTFDG